MIDREICKNCYSNNGWNMSPINDGRWGKGVYCPKANKWLQHWRCEAPENCEYQMEHLILGQKKHQHKNNKSKKVLV